MILFALAIVVVAGSGVRHLVFTNSYRAYFGPTDPHLLAYEKIENTYVKDDTVMIVIAPKSGKVFSNETLEVVQVLTKRAWQIPFSNRVDSVTNFQHTEAVEDDLVVADLVRETGSLSDADLARFEAIALAEPALLRRLISPDARVTAINVNVQLPGIDEQAETPAVMEHARELVAAAETKFPEYDYYITGVAAMHLAFAEAGFRDMSTLVPVSFAVMAGLLTLLAGGLTGALVTILVIGFSVVAAMGVGGYLGYAISPTTAIAPNVILTVAVANSVHILMSFFHGLRKGESKFEALEESLRINVHPVFLASATTAVGFMTMNFSPVPPFQELGTIIALGVVISFVLSVTFLPALIAVLPIATKGGNRLNDTAMEWLAKFVVGNRTVLLWCAIGVCVVLVAQVPRNEVNDMFLQYFDEKMKFRSDTDFMLENLTGLYLVNYSLESSESGGVSEPEYLRQADAFAEWWRSQPGVVHVSTFTDTMKRLNKNMHGDDPGMYRLPENRDLAAQFLLLYEMSLPYGLDLNNAINIDKSASRLTVTLDPITVNKMLAVTDAAEDWLNEHAPAIEADHGSGMMMMFSHIALLNVNSMLVGTTVALVLISGILVFALRSLKLGVLSLVPNLAPIAMGFGASSMAGLASDCRSWAA